MSHVDQRAIFGTPFQIPTPLLITMRDVYNGFVRITHNSMALAGIVLAAILITVSARPDLRQDGEKALLDWLQARQTSQSDMAAAEPVIAAEPDAADRATALLPASLPKRQANVAYWLSRKYRVAPEPLGVLVSEAFAVGEQIRLDPTLILAVMAIESRFNPFAQSPVGAQGLMQVLTRVHTDKYEDFGGKLAAFDPVSNVRVGAQVLRDCIKRAGSTEGGLRLYVGAVSSDGSDYINKVTAEHLRIQSVALGKPMPTVFPTYQPAPTETTVEPTPVAIDSMVKPVPMVDGEVVVSPQTDTAAAEPVRS